MEKSEFLPAELKIPNGKDKESVVKHIFERQDCDALWAAYAAKRPLLLRGDPGTGKSQTARAIAAHLGWAFVKETLNGSTELSDLHWHFDAVGRLAEAQVRGSEQDVKSNLDPHNFLSPGAFWWAYDWENAASHYENCKTRMRAAPNTPEADLKTVPDGVVLLLDELDKAQPDLANGLLETLGDRSFTVPYLNSGEQNTLKDHKPIAADENANILVVITTNEERELPQAFLRRCLVHTLMMGPGNNELEDASNAEKTKIKWLVDRGELHFGEQIGQEVYEKAAKLVWEDRAEQSIYKPGLAEYIDLLTAIATVSDKKEQVKILNDIYRYALKKERQY